MEQLIKEIQNYAAAVGLHPSTVIQRAGAGGGAVWSSWQNGASCAMKTADKLRRYMAENPPASPTQKEDAA